MVFQDYELINTKRVNRKRLSTDVFNHRLWLAFGGWNSIYFAGVSSVLAMHYTNTCSSTLIPGRQVLSRAGFLPYFKHVGVKFLLPALFGMNYGIHVFGDIDEFKKLCALASVYKPELDNYKKDIYYT